MEQKDSEAENPFHDGILLDRVGTEKRLQCNASGSVEADIASLAY